MGQFNFWVSSFSGRWIFFFPPYSFTKGISLLRLLPQAGHLGSLALFCKVSISLPSSLCKWKHLLNRDNQIFFVLLLFCFLFAVYYPGFCSLLLFFLLESARFPILSFELSNTLKSMFVIMNSGYHLGDTP